MMIINHLTSFNSSFGDHEIRIGEIAHEMGFKNISLSHQIIAMQKYVPRSHTGNIRYRDRKKR